MATQQQFLGAQPRFTAPSRPIHGLATQLGGGASFCNRTLGMGGTQALASGLEDLKRTADTWIQDQQATQQRNEFMSNKLKEQQKVNQELTKEKQNLQNTIGALKARIKEDGVRIQHVLDKISLLENEHGTLAASVNHAGGQLNKIEEQSKAMESMINNQARTCEDTDGKLQDLLAHQQETTEEVQQASALVTRLQKELLQARRQEASKEQALAQTLKELERFKSDTQAAVKALEDNLIALKAACDDKDQQMLHMAQEHEAALQSRRDAHSTALHAKQQEVDDAQQQLEQVRKDGMTLEKEHQSVQATVQEHLTTISKLEAEIQGLATTRDSLTAQLRQAHADLEKAATQIGQAKSHAHDSNRQLLESQQAAQAQAEKATEAQAKLQQEIEDLQAAAVQATEKHAALQEQLKTVQEHYEQLQEVVTGKEGVVVELQQQLAAEKAAHGAQLDKAQQEIESFKQQLHSQRTTYNRTQEASAKRLEELMQSAGKAQELTKKIDFLKTQLSELQQYKADREAHSTEQAKQNADKISEMAQAAEAAAAAAAKEASSKLEAKLAAAAAKASNDLKEVKAAAAAELASTIARVKAGAKAEIAKMAEQLKEATADLEKLKSGRDQDTDHINSINQLLQEKASFIKQLQQDNAVAAAALQDKLDEQLKVASDLEGAVQDKETELAVITRQLEELHEINQKLEAERDEAQASLAEKEAMLTNIVKITAPAAAPAAVHYAANGDNEAVGAADDELETGVGQVDDPQLGSNMDGEVLEPEAEEDLPAPLTQTHHHKIVAGPNSNIKAVRVTLKGPNNTAAGKQLATGARAAGRHVDKNTQRVIGRVGAVKQGHHNNHTAAAAAGGASKGRSSAAAGRAVSKTPIEFDGVNGRRLSTKTPHNAEADLHAHKRGIADETGVDPVSKKRQRAAPLQQIWTDLNSQMTATQDGPDSEADEEQDAYGSYETGAALAVPNRSMAPPANTVAKTIHRHVVGATAAANITGMRAKPTNSGRHLSSQQQHPKAGAGGKTAAAAPFGDVGGHVGGRGRFGTMSVHSGAISADRGVEVSSGSQQARMKQRRAGASGRSSRMAPPALKFTDGAAAAQQKAEHLSIAADIFGSSMFA